MGWVEVRSAAGGQQIWITERPEMLRIMRHEFHDNTGTAFDAAPLAQYLSTLTVPQVKLLMSYPLEKYAGKHRLVIFVALDRDISLPMCADQCDTAATLISSNSHFAVFHCDGVTQMVSLVCYTKEFNLFLHRPTLESRDTPSPNVYKISAMNMSYVPSGEGDTIWNRVSTIDSHDVGTAIYGGEPVLNPATGVLEPRAPNALHGMINTVGCWMLFQNYNWHKPKQADFLNLYRRYRKNGMNFTASMDDELRRLGYAEGSPDDQHYRFLDLERNYAFTWFTRDVIGIEYFSYNQATNETNIEDSIQPPIFLVPSAPVTYNSHSWGHRHAHERSFTMTKGLWTENALGFQTAADFGPFAGKETYQVESKSWADIYFYTM